MQKLLGIMILISLVAVASLSALANPKPLKAAAPHVLKATVHNADGGVLMLTDAERRKWVSDQALTDSWTQQQARANAGLAAAQAKQAADWVAFKAAHPGLSDDMLIDAKTGEVSTP